MNEQEARFFLELWVWGCGDACNCWQPRINVVYKLGAETRMRRTVWKGTFVNDPYEEPGLFAQMKDEITEAATRFGIQLNMDADDDDYAILGIHEQKNISYNEFFKIVKEAQDG